MADFPVQWNRAVSSVVTSHNVLLDNIMCVGVSSRTEHQRGFEYCEPKRLSESRESRKALYRALVVVEPDYPKTGMLWHC